MNLLKKVSLSALMFVTVFSIGGFGSVKMAHAATLMAGDLVKGPNSDAVYYIDGTMKHVFPDKGTYMTWYSNFDAVKKVTVADLDMYSTGSAVAYRPGTYLVKTPDSAFVYAVEPGGKLRKIPSESVAMALYGSSWAKWIRDIHPLTMSTTYAVTSNDMTAAAPSVGTVLQKTGDSTIYYFDGTNIRPFASSAAFDANNLNWDYVVKVSSLGTWTVGSSITGAETFATISGVGTSVVTGPAGNLTVALSPNTPAANGILLGGAARVPMTTVRLTAGSTPVIIDSLTIERKGVASDSEFASFDLLDGNTMLPLNDSSKSLNSNHQAVFNDDITVPANASWDVIVSANMAADLSAVAGEYPVISVAGMVLKNNSTMSGTLPIMGNVFLSNGTITVGTATIASGSNNPSAVTKQVGQKDYIVTSIKVTNNSSATGQNMTLKSVTFTNNGSTSPTDVANLRLVNSNTGVTLGTMATVTGDKVSFTNLNLPILKGNNVNLDLKLDIVGGSGRTIDYDVQKQGDVVVFDELRGYNVLPTYPNSSEPYFNAAAATVDNGHLRIESVAVATQTIQENKNGVLIGKFKFVVEGEPINITRLPIKTILNTSTAGANITDITNITLKDPAGMAVVSGQDPTSNGWSANSNSDQVGTATTTDTFTAPIGETVYSVYADLSSDFSANDTIQTQINPAMVIAKGDTTGDTLTNSTDITPTVDVTGSTMTVKSVDLNVSVSSSPAAQTLVAGASEVEVADIVLDAATSGSDVRVTQFKIPVKTTAPVFPDIVTSFKIYVGGVQVPVDSTSTSYSTAGSTAGGNATTTLTIATGNLTIPALQSKTVVIKANIGTGATSGSFKVGSQVDSITAIDSEGQTFTPDYTPNDGQSMTLSGGGILNISNATDPRAGMVVGNTTTVVGQFTAQAKNDTIKLNSFGFTIQAPDQGRQGTTIADQLNGLEVWELGGGSALGTALVTGNNATVTPSSPISLSINSSKTYVVKANWKLIDHLTSPAVSGGGLKVNMTNVDTTGQAAGSSTVTLNGNGTAFNTQSSFLSTPTVTLDSASNTISGSGVFDLFKFHITPSAGGPVGIAKLSFGITTSTVSVAGGGFQLYQSDSSGSQGNLISGNTDFKSIFAGTAGSKSLVAEARMDNSDTNSYNTTDSGENFYFSGTKYFTLRGTISGHTGSSTDSESVATVLAGDAAYASSSLVNYAAVDGTDTGLDDFIWSDLNFDLNSTTATQNLGWFNGFRVPGLDNNSTTAETISG